MAFDVEQLLNTLPEPRAITTPVAIYGAGNIGREMCRYLRARQDSVVAFIDRKAQPGDQFEGVPILTLDSWAATHDSAAHTVVLGLNNPYVNIPSLMNDLAPFGFGRIVNAIEFVNLFPDFVKVTPHEQEFAYWLAPRSLYRAELESVRALLALLDDETSRDIVERVLTTRLGGDYAVLRAPTLDDGYDPEDLPDWREPIRLIDCGAFDGDTYDRFEGRGYAIEAVASFEPEMGNYAKLVAKRRTAETISFPCGVADETKALRFRRGLGVASYVSPDGEDIIQCVRMDDAIPDFAPTLLKMDIEGAEVPAILGAEQIIRRHRPDLILCLYHTPEHLWQIPLLIRSWNLGYRFHIRVHCENTCDLILYAYATRAGAARTIV